MRTPDEIVRRVEKRLHDTWPSTVLAEVAKGAPVDLGTSDREPHEAAVVAPWPYSFPLGKTSSADIAQNFGDHVRSVQAWRDWASAHRVQLIETPRLIAGTQQSLPTHLVVANLDVAAAIAGADWPERLAVARERTALLRRRFPATVRSATLDLTRALRGAARLSVVDFDILCRVSAWFRLHPAAVRAGLTPRQVPIEGVHAKWLNTHQALVRALVGADDLGLLAAHPARVHFTYLDPRHLDVGRRQHDSYSIGDTVELPYQPAVVVISENKDTAVGFPRVRGGIAIEGAGAGGSTIAAIPWLPDAALVVYWGDMDADGLEILNEFRARGVPAVSMFMNTRAYATYARYGTNLDRGGLPLKVAPAASVPHLREDEFGLYALLTGGSAPVLRIEQERIPLEVAAAELQRLSTLRPAAPWQQLPTDGSAP